MLIRNGISRGSNPGWRAGANVYHVGLENYLQGGSRRNWYANTVAAAPPAINNGFPSGAESTVAWMLPMKGGGLAAFNTIQGEGTIDASLTMGRALSAELTGSGTISTANLSLIVQLLADLSGSGTLNAEMQGIAQLATELAGTGDISAALGLIVSMVATLEGEGTLDGSTLRGTASLSAEITSTGEVVTAASCAEAVWRAILTDFSSNPASAAATLIDAAAGGGGGGDWTTLEKAQIRNRLGIDGSASSPTATPTLASPGDEMALVDGAVAEDKVAAGALTADAFDADTDTYQAKVWLFLDDGAGLDRYAVGFFKNGQPLTTGITSPTIQVIKVSDGSDLIASTALTQIASLGLYKHNEGSDRVVAGEAYFAQVEATIGAATRAWYQPVGRDD